MFQPVFETIVRIDFLIDCFSESTNLQVDETNTKVRAAHRRCTLLLREIPEFTDEREVKAMFVGCPPYTSLSYGLNNSWYVTFETEEATQLAFLHLQNLRKSFNGKQICVRIKTGSAPLPDHGGDHGRYSPAKSETFSGLGSGIATVTTSNGYITGFPATTTFILNPNSTRATSETELNLDQLMGPFGYSIRGIFQPKESEPPSMSDEDGTVPLNEARKTKSPKLSVAAANVGKSLLGPPSTEIVESLLSAAAEANETKRREKEVQRQQWQQIMDGLAPTPSMIGGPRVTDMPFIKRAPLLHRFTSQESSDIEVALDIQRAARKQEKEAKLQQQVQQQHQAQQQEQTQPQQEHRPPSSQQHQYHDGYRQTTTSKNYSDRSNKDYNHYNGYSSGERSGYDKSERRPNTPYRDPSKRGYDSRSDRSGKSGDYYKPKERNSERSSYNTTSNNYYYDRTSTYNNPPRYERPRYPPAERKSFTSRPTYAPSTPQIQTTSYAAEPTQAEVPEPERPRSILSSEPLITPPELIIVPSSALHSDTASTTSSRKKDNSESSEYNFVDGDFPSLVDKQNVKAKEKEKAKFSAVVAGKKNDVKKSYAQTLRKPDRASR